MNWIMDNWQIISIFLGVAIAVLIVIFVPKNWLLKAVTDAEHEYGDGYGEYQKMVVYNLLLKEFPILSKFLPYPVFSWLVAAALRKMRKILDKKPKIAEFVKDTNKEVL